MQCFTSCLASLKTNRLTATDGGGGATSDRFQRFAAKDHPRAELDRLTEDEEALLLGRRRKSPVAMAMQMHVSESTVHRMQRSIIAKIG